MVLGHVHVQDVGGGAVQFRWVIGVAKPTHAHAFAHAHRRHQVTTIGHVGGHFGTETTFTGFVGRISTSTRARKHGNAVVHHVATDEPVRLGRGLAQSVLLVGATAIEKGVTPGTSEVVGEARLATANESGPGCE